MSMYPGLMDGTGGKGEGGRREGGEGGGEGELHECVSGGGGRGGNKVDIVCEAVRKGLVELDENK